MKLVHDPANDVPDAGELECIAKQLTANGFKVFAGEIRSLWRAHEEALALLRELNDALKIPKDFQPRVDAVLDRAEEKS